MQIEGLNVWRCPRFVRGRDLLFVPTGGNKGKVFLYGVTGGWHATCRTQSKVNQRMSETRFTVLQRACQSTSTEGESLLRQPEEP